MIAVELRKRYTYDYYGEESTAFVAVLQIQMPCAPVAGMAINISSDWQWEEICRVSYDVERQVFITTLEKGHSGYKGTDREKHKKAGWTIDTSD